MKGKSDVEARVVEPSKKTELVKTIEDMKINLDKRLGKSETSDKKDCTTREELTQALKDLYNETRAIQRPFGETIKEILRKQGFEKQWHGKTILDLDRVSKATKLNRDIFEKSIHRPEVSIGMNIVISICIGLKLSPILTNRLLQSAGLAFRLDNAEHLAYMFLLEYCRDYDIEKCNQLLEELGVPKSRRLGSQGRSKDGQPLEYNMQKRKIK